MSARDVTVAVADTDCVDRRVAADPETSVTASVVVRAPIEHVFRVFTADMTAWWPASHHIGAAPMIATVVEPRIGGRWYELGDDGSDCQWGVVLAWDPPHHVALSWHLDGDFRYDADAQRSSRVDVRFRPLADGSTEVELEHTGLDRHGPTWQRLRAQVPEGWAFIIGRFAARAETTSRSVS
jgi:uncharacterized protein YndB with AHSA1/START domain